MYLSNRHLHPLNIPRFAYRRTRNWRNIHFRIHAYSISIPGSLQRLTPRGVWSLGPLLNDEWNNLDRKWGRNKLFMSFEIKSVPTNFQKLETDLTKDFFFNFWSVIKHLLPSNIRLSDGDFTIFEEMKLSILKNEI